MPAHPEGEISHEYCESSTVLTEEDAEWLFGLYPSLEFTDNWYRKINKHLVFASRPIPKGVLAREETRIIHSMRGSVFRQLGFMDEDHPLNEVWSSQLEEDGEGFDRYMNPKFFIEHGRRLHRTGTDVAATFMEAPILFSAPRNLIQRHHMWRDDAWVASLESDQRIPTHDSAERLSRVLGIQHFLGVVATEVPHILYDSTRKQITLARIALELYGAQDFSDPKAVSEFLTWSPEALLLTAIKVDSPTLDDIHLQDTEEDRKGRKMGRLNFARLRREKLIEELLASKNETVLGSSALKAYLHWSPLAPSERDQFAEYKLRESLSWLKETHLPWLQDLVGEEVDLNPEWFERMNMLMEKGSATKRMLEMPRSYYRQQFFSTLGLYDNETHQQLPPPHHVVEFAELLERWQVKNIAYILKRSIHKLLLYKPETNEKIMSCLAEKGYDCSNPEVQALLPSIVATDYANITTRLRPFEEVQAGKGLFVTPKKKRRKKETSGRAASERKAIVKKKQPAAKKEEAVPLVTPLELAYSIAVATDTSLAPDMLVETLKLDQLSSGQVSQLADYIDNHIDGPSLGTVRRWIAEV